jgi:hypothetical protein
MYSRNSKNNLLRKSRCYNSQTIGNNGKYITFNYLIKKVVTTQY